MKKIFLVLFVNIFLINLWSEDIHLIKLLSFNNGTNENELKTHLTGEDDTTGNILQISPSGDIFVHCVDKHEVDFIDIKNKLLVFKYNTKCIPQDAYIVFKQVINNSMLFTSFYGKTSLIGENNELKFHIDLHNDFDISINIPDVFYDEKSDILFIMQDNNELYSIIHPSLDKLDNIKNYKNSEETKRAILMGTYGNKFSLDNDGELNVDGKYFTWGRSLFTYKYVNTINTKRNYINVYNGVKPKILNFHIPDNEELESNIFHPCGDAYFLSMNWSTQTHTLWFIENTWDPEWREQWYKDHPDAMQP